MFEKREFNRGLLIQEMDCDITIIRVIVAALSFSGSAIVVQGSFNLV